MTELDRLKTSLADRYAVEREIGAGGMATVYLAQDLRHARRVAIKVLNPDLASTMGTARFLREIQLASQLQHPHILTLIDSGETDGTPYYVMPFVDGESLRDRLQREGSLPIDDALRIATEVADALDFAHARDIVHRDIKPGNILMDGNHAVVTDFGIARAMSVAAGDRLTETGIIIGTPEYMSPEQASGSLHIDARSDVYALSCVVYEMLGGEPPFTGPTAQAVIARQLHEEPRSLRVVRSTVPPALEAAIATSLSKVPADRHPTPGDFASALAAGQAESPGARRPPLVNVMAAAGVVVISVVLVFMLRLLWGPSLEVDENRVAVFPFQARGDGAMDWVEQLPDLLSTTLEGTPGVRVADTWALWGSLRPRRGAQAVSPSGVDDATQLAVNARAGRYVMGAIANDGRDLNVQMRIYAAGESEPSDRIDVTGSADSISVLVQRAAAQIIARIWPTENAPNIPRLDQYTTRSADALKSYLRAKEEMRRGRVDSADVYIDDALRRDSTFALALTDAIRIKTWMTSLGGYQYGLTDLAEKAAAASESLSERNRLRAESMLASVFTDGVAAAAAAERIIEIDSSDIDAWISLNYYQRVYGWQFGATEDDVRRSADRIVELDPNYLPGVVIRTLYAKAPGGPDPEMARLRQTDTTNLIVRRVLLAIRAVTVDSAEFQSLLPTVVDAPYLDWYGVLARLRRDMPVRADLLLERSRTARSERIRNRAGFEQTRLWVAEGRLAEAHDAIHRDELQVGTGTAHLHFVGAALAGVGDLETAEEAARELTEHPAMQDPDANRSAFPIWNTAWHLGAYAAMFGDTSVARTWQDYLGRFESGSRSDWVGALQADIEARLAVRRDDLDGARESARRAYELWTFHSETTFEFWGSPGIRFHLGQLLNEAGRADSAAAMFRGLILPEAWFGYYTVRAMYELGVLAEERGDVSEARLMYGGALNYWRHGGPEVDGWRRATEAALTRLEESTDR